MFTHVNAYRASVKLSRTFAISKGSQDVVDNLFLKLIHESFGTGWGEAAPSGRVTGETHARAEHAMKEFEANPEWVSRILEDAEHIPGGTREPAVRNALLTSFLDAQGTKQRRPLHKLLNLPDGTVESSITISVGPAAAALKEAAEYDAAKWEIFKVKLGGGHDEEVMRALRDRYPEKKIRVDANEAWTLDVAKKRIPFLEKLNVEFVEQPLPRDQWAGSKLLAQTFEMPIILDEPILDSSDVLEAVRQDACDGINIKLNKCGGPFEARRMVKLAKDNDLKVMMGCMLESGLGCAEGAAFAGVLDYADLDGNVLMVQDPFTGFQAARGVIETPHKPGVGVTPNPAVKLLRLADAPTLRAPAEQ